MEGDQEFKKGIGDSNLLTVKEPAGGQAHSLQCFHLNATLKE